MSGRGILDADMATVGGWLRDGWRWWIDELAAMVPDRWRRGAAGPRLGFDGAQLDPAALAALGRGRAAAIVLDRDVCLVREIERPAMSARDAARMVMLEADRLMPLGTGAMVVAGRIVSREGAAIRIAVAGLPRMKADRLAAALADAGIAPTAVLLPFEPSPGGAIDFLPALRAVGLFARQDGARRFWWTAVAFLFAINLALLVWRDVQRTDALQALVDGQRPAVAASRAIAGRLAGAERIAAAVRQRRATRDPLVLLDRIAAALPPGAWVQRLAWDGSALRLAGYRPRDANIVAALRRQPGFRRVRSAAGDVTASLPSGQPFEIAAETGPAEAPR